MNRILRLGYVQLRVHDMSESLYFYERVLGLHSAGVDSTGRAYLKARDESDHSCVILREAPTPGLDIVGFKLSNEAEVDRLEMELSALGLMAEEIPAGEMLGSGRRLRFSSPCGHVIECYATRAVSDMAARMDPPLWDPASERGIGVQRLDHCVLLGPQMDAARKLFVDTLGLHVSERVLAVDGVGEYALSLACGGKAADIAFVRHAEAGKLHRVSFSVSSAEQVLRAADVFSMSRVTIDAGPFRDPVGRRLAVHGFDPSGNRIEIASGGYPSYPDLEPVTWSWKRAGAGMNARAQRTRDRLLPEFT